MATRTKKISEIAAEPVKVDQNRSKYVIGACSLLLLLVLYWYKTGNWPIAAIVNYRPIFRFQLNNMMYQQIGLQTLDSLIIEQLIKDDISAKRIVIADTAIDAKIAEIKKSLGSDDAYKQALAAQNMDETKLRAQVKIQLGLEKLVADEATDSSQIQSKIYEYLTNIKTGKKIWTLTSAQK